MSIRRFKRLAVILGVPGAAVAAVVLQAALSAGSPTIPIRGAAANPDTFSLTTLQDPDDRALVESAREAVFDACMVEKGFTTPPGPEQSGYTAAYYLAATGEDLSSTTPPPLQTIELPDGSTSELGTSWTPETCRYRAYLEFGVEPLLREALRLKMWTLQIQADSAAADGLSSVASEWATCLGGDSADPQDLLNTIDGGVSAHSPYGQDADACLTDEMRAEAIRIRAGEHLRVAAENDEIVEAWVKVIDTELDKAKATAR